MNDKLLMENYLLVLKSTVEVYVHGTLESSNEECKSLLRECLNDTLIHQEDTYNEMTKYGWYTTNNIKSSEIKKTINKLESN